MSKLGCVEVVGSERQNKVVQLHRPFLTVDNDPAPLPMMRHAHFLCRKTVWLIRGLSRGLTM